MKDIIIHSDPLLGKFTIQDLIYFLQDILKDFDNKTVSSAPNQNIKKQLQFIIGILTDSL